MALRFTHLTRPGIRALKLGKKITECGITVERLGNGDIRYSVNIMVDRERIRCISITAKRCTAAVTTPTPLAHRAA